MAALKRFINDINGDAIVEATILFPIMIMIFAALVLLAMYLPQRTILQEAAQYTATALATQASDTYVAFDDDGNRIQKTPDISVYVTLMNGILGNNLDVKDQAEQIAAHMAQNAILPVSSTVKADLDVINYLVYQKLTVTLTQTIPMPVDLSFIGFPTELVLVQSASAVVQNGDEFVRDIDIAKDMVEWLDKKIGVSEWLEEKIGASKPLSDALGMIKEVTDFFGLGG